MLKIVLLNESIFWDELLESRLETECGKYVRRQGQLCTHRNMKTHEEAWKRSANRARRSIGETVRFTAFYQALERRR